MSDLDILLTHQHPKQRTDDVHIETASQYDASLFSSKGNQIIEIVQVIG